MWSYGLDLRSNKLTVVKVVVSSEENYRYSNCLFVEVFDYFLKCSNEMIFLQAIILLQVSWLRPAFDSFPAFDPPAVSIVHGLQYQQLVNSKFLLVRIL